MLEQSNLLYVITDPYSYKYKPGDASYNNTIYVQADQLSGDC